jgi:two-component system response regulator VanR
VRDVYDGFECLNSHVSVFLLLDLSLDGAISFIEKVVTTFYNPPPYILAANVFNCSLEKAEILNLGADACLEKPFDHQEIIATVNAVLRRADRLAHPKPFHPSPQIECGELTIDPMRRNVNIDGKSVNLTVKEFDILYLLASYPGVVFSKAQIYERIWGEEYLYPSTSVSDLISSMRRKLGLDPRGGRYIQTVFGAGYRFISQG